MYLRKNRQSPRGSKVFISFYEIQHVVVHVGVLIEIILYIVKISLAFFIVLFYPILEGDLSRQGKRKEKFFARKGSAGYDDHETYR